MISELANHLWQSTVFALAVALLARMFRKNQASVRYWLWFSASVKFFVPFTLLMTLGNQLEWAPAAQQIATPEVSVTLAQVSRPFVDEWALGGPLSASPGRRGSEWFTVAVLGLWVCGVVTMGLIRLRMWRRVRAAVRASSPWAMSGVAMPADVELRTTPGLMEPGVVGLWRPVLLMPSGIEEDLTPRQLEAVLTHEFCHIGRRDNLTAAIHMVVEAVFWFHPLVWWIGSRLVDERERACDEEVLREFGEPQTYAEGILIVCKRYVETPLVCVSGVSGANLRRRIEAIMTNSIGRRPSAATRVALAAAAITAFGLPVIVGAISPLQQSTPQSAATPRFEVASIKPCKSTADGGRGGGPSPGRLYLPCLTAFQLIQAAYVGIPPNPNLPVVGGPDWIRSELYQISATAEGGFGAREMTTGPMMQGLLEDRFKLRIRRETREVPVYALVAATGGLKVSPTPVLLDQGGLERFDEGGCVVFDPDSPHVDEPRRALRDTTCNTRGTGRRPPNATLIGMKISLNEFAGLLGFFLDRPVIDRTGIQGLFNAHVIFAPDTATPQIAANFPASADDPPTAAGIFTALQEQLGLKLEPTRGPGEFFVIDSIDRPTEN